MVSLFPPLGLKYNDFSEEFFFVSSLSILCPKMKCVLHGVCFHPSFHQLAGFFHMHLSLNLQNNSCMD